MGQEGLDKREKGAIGSNKLNMIRVQVKYACYHLPKEQFMKLTSKLRLIDIHSSALGGVLEKHGNMCYYVHILPL